MHTKTNSGIKIENTQNANGRKTNLMNYTLYTIFETAHTHNPHKSKQISFQISFNRKCTAQEEKTNAVRDIYARA